MAKGLGPAGGRGVCCEGGMLLLLFKLKDLMGMEGFEETGIRTCLEEGPIVAALIASVEVRPKISEYTPRCLIGGFDGR